MLKRGKAQTAMEYLMTYGFALIFLIIVVAFLFYINIVPDKCQPNFQISNNIINLVDQKFVGSNNEIVEIRNKNYLIIRNNINRRLEIDSIELYNGDIFCGQVPLPGEGQFALSMGETSNLLQGEVNNLDCQGKIGECYLFNIKLKYKDIGTGLIRTQTGYLGGRFENVSDYWALGEWTTTQDSYYNVSRNKNILLLNDVDGTPINYCNTDDPPTEFLYSFPQSSEVFWDDPQGCNSGGAGQVGFENACTGANPGTLEEGWIHNNLYVDRIFSDSTLYLEGIAAYYDQIEGKNKTNGICMNDNLYFYVNGVLKYWGGTTGVKVGIDWEYEEINGTTDEVLSGCGNCNVDNSDWCIPAFNLNAGDFVFGEWNDIDILIEDYCTSGGMNQLRISMV
ncbi:hypothetical protein K8R47_02885 [archaeon]|nr:hypothetical protein [archaeon]